MYLKEFIKNLRPCLAGILLDRIIVFVPVESDEDLFTIKNTSIDFAEKILKETHGKESSVRIGHIYGKSERAWGRSICSKCQ